MRQDPRAWNEGYQAGLRGTRLTAQRYPAGTTMNWSWSSGYIEGDAIRLKNRQRSLDRTAEH